jgi:UDP-arabinose 4-epimerase
MGQTILVTGSAGYIGSQTCKLLAGAGHRPVCFDDFSTGRRDFLRFGPLVEDVRDPEALEQAFAEHKPDQVMHFAAKIEVEESTRKPALYYVVNVAGTAALLEACLRHKVRQFTFSSTAAVYAEPKTSPVGLDAPLRRAAAPAPPWPAGI